MTARFETDQEWQEQKMDESQKHGRNEVQQRNQTIAFALLGGAIIAAILLITTVWASNKARISLRRGSV